MQNPAGWRDLLWLQKFFLLCLVRFLEVQKPWFFQRNRCFRFWILQVVDGFYFGCWMRLLSLDIWYCKITPSPYGDKTFALVNREIAGEHIHAIIVNTY